MSKEDSPPPLKRILLRDQVAANLRAYIPKLPAGTKLESEGKIAAKFGVAVHTVREALNALAQEGLIERRSAVGTFVTDAAKRRHVAIFFAAGQLNPNYWSLRIMNQLQARLTEQGIRVKTYWSSMGPEAELGGVGYEEFLHDLSSGRIAAIASVESPVGSEARNLIRKNGIPIVYTTSGEDPDDFTVATNFAEVIRQGVRYLAQQGCRHIAWLTWGKPLDCEIFCAALEEQGLTFHPCWTRFDLHPGWTAAGYEEFREIWVAADEKPDGLLVSDDVLLPDVATAIRELGISVPGQLTVVATANKGGVTSPFFPAARIEFDPDEVAEAMGGILGKLVRKEPIAERNLLMPIRWLLPDAATQGAQKKISLLAKKAAQTRS